MTRRAVIAGLGLLALTASSGVQAQTTRTRVIGFLGPTTFDQQGARMDAFLAELRELGYSEGRNIHIEYRWADGRYERLPELAAELVRRNVDVIVTHSTPGALAAKRATTSIPIVMASVGDAVAAGIVGSIARPGGNVTGLSFFTPELSGKRLELLKEAVPGLRRVAVLINPDNRMTDAAMAAMEQVARALDLELRQISLREASALAAVVAEIAAGGFGGFVILDDPMLVANAQSLAALAAHHHLPAVGFPEFAHAGGLLAFGVSLPAMWRRAARFVDKILKGTKPGDLPIEQAATFEVAVNLRAASTIGLTLPMSVLQRADTVID